MKTKEDVLDVLSMRIQSLFFERGRLAWIVTKSDDKDTYSTIAHHVDGVNRPGEWSVDGRIIPPEDVLQVDTVVDFDEMYQDTVMLKVILNQTFDSMSDDMKVAVAKRLGS